MATSKLDLKEFEKKIRIRALEPDDFEAVVGLQRQCFPGMKTWTREHFDSQTRIFPDGQLCVVYQGRIVASSSSLIVDFSQYSEWHNWLEIADRGFIRNHDPQGDTLYGIEMMVSPEFRGMKLARRLYDARKEIARQRNLTRIIIGGRIPGYGKVAEEMTAREYVERVIDKSMVDPVLTPQLSNGFALKGLIPDYFPSDAQSRGYATFLEWTNLDHVATGRRSYRAVSPVRICVVQYEMRPVKDFEDFGTQAEFFVDVGSDHKSDIIVFPELFTLQLLSLVHAERPGLAARLLAEFTPRYLDLFTKLAIRYNINIVGGSQFTLENGALYNVAYLFRRDGTLGKQYKIHVTPNERRWWGVVGGDRVEVFDTDVGRVSILICYDVEFPELSRIAAAKGAQIVFVPFNTDERYGYLRVRHCAVARCIENHLYVATSGCVGNLPSVENADIHYAQSGIYTPSDFPFSRDAIAAETMANAETVIVHDVDLELLKQHRRTGTVQNWSDRRLDLYQVRYREGDETHEI